MPTYTLADLYHQSPTYLATKDDIFGLCVDPTTIAGTYEDENVIGEAWAVDSQGSVCIGAVESVAEFIELINTPAQWSQQADLLFEPGHRLYVE